MKDVILNQLDAFIRTNPDLIKEVVSVYPDIRRGLTKRKRENYDAAYKYILSVLPIEELK